MGAKTWFLIVAVCVGYVLLGKACKGASAAGGRFHYADVVSDADLTPAEPVKRFRGEPCTTDCSGHQAGYEWARRHGIEHPDDCGGTSPSFVAGCQVFASQR